ncbi:alpha/beta fold hydrolase [Calothrix sp. 336/3]|uniref:alpha/beta fold hydrolase n=1 Tax=Calothrix sp. 336/3 TaxID=1337936 RepID=UPI003529BE43
MALNESLSGVDVSAIDYPAFLPAAFTQLTESTSIALGQTIQQTAINTPITTEPILTTYVRQGSGNIPILLIHGFDSSILEFRRLIPLLSEHHDTCAVDLLGFGFTARPAGITFNKVNIKTHLYHFWQTQINQPVILVGASMGGAAAIDFTLTYPQSVEKLILIDSAGFLGSSPLVKFMFPPLDAWATNFLRSPNIRQNISRAAYKDKTFATLDAQICASLHLEHPEWSKALIAFTKSGGYSAFKLSEMAAIQQPTLILWGDDDRILGTKDAKKFQQVIPNSQLIWIENSGHVPHLEKSQVTAKHILEFCK